MLYLLSKNEMCNFEKYQNEKKGFHIKTNYLSVSVSVFVRRRIPAGL
jgi:hypothetical protein